MGCFDVDDRNCRVRMYIFSYQKDDIFQHYYKFGIHPVHATPIDK